MRRSRLALPLTSLVVAFVALAPAGAAEPPADAFCVILFEPSPDFSRVRILVDEDSSLEERAALWPSVDLDRNGVISVVEKEAFRWSNTKVFPNVTDLGIKAITLRPEAPYTKSPPQKPVYATTWRQIGHVFHQRDYKLPERLTQTSELETQEVREFGFELEPGRSSRFTVFGGREPLGPNLSAAPSYTEQPRSVIEYVVVRAPEGWLVQRIEGASYNGTFVLSPNQQSVDVPAFDTKRPYNITFVNPDLEKRLGADDTPGPGALLLLLALGALALARGRRRG